MPWYREDAYVEQLARMLGQDSSGQAPGSQMSIDDLAAAGFSIN